MESLVTALLEIRRAENKTGRVADTVLIALLEELKAKREEIRDDRAFSAGLAAAANAGAPNANYVAKAARSAATRPAGGVPLAAQRSSQGGERHGRTDLDELFANDDDD